MLQTAQTTQLNKVLSCLVLPLSRSIVTILFSHCLQVGRIVTSTRGCHRGLCRQIVFAPPDLVMAAFDGGRVTKWRFPGNDGNPELLSESYYQHPASVTCLIRHGTATKTDFCVTGCTDGKVRIWDDDKTLLKTLEGHDRGIRAVSQNKSSVCQGSSSMLVAFVSFAVESLVG